MAKTKLKYKAGDEVLMRVKIVNADNGDTLPYRIAINGCYHWIPESDLIPAPKKRKAKRNG